MKRSSTNYSADAAPIRKIILAEESILLRLHPWLGRRDFIAMAVLILSMGSVVFSGFLYYVGAIPALVCVVVTAFFLAFLHELEHDLIHRLYFRESGVLSSAMMLLVWVFRGNIISPWYRQKIHLQHHRLSGQSGDIEERLIGNGMKFGVSRVLAMCDGMLSVLFRLRELGSIPGYSFWKILKASFPVTLIFYSLLILVIAQFFFGAQRLNNNVSEYLDLMFVVILLPNILRQASLNILSSTMHYFGNVERSVEEVQILDNWIFLPLQLFCCFFGKTHAVHHFVIAQPFYLRIWIAFRVNKSLEDHGVRRGDWQSLFRQNSLQR